MGTRENCATDSCSLRTICSSPAYPPKIRYEPTMLIVRKTNATGSAINSSPTLDANIKLRTDAQFTAFPPDEFRAHDRMLHGLSETMNCIVRQAIPAPAAPSR